MTVRPQGPAAVSTETAGRAGPPIVSSAERKREKNPKSELQKAPHSPAAFQVALEFEFFSRSITAKRAMIGRIGRAGATAPRRGLVR
jgi:hypothetical protein